MHCCFPELSSPVLPFSPKHLLLETHKVAQTVPCLGDKMGIWRCPAWSSQKTLDSWNRANMWKPHEKLQISDTTQATHCKAKIAEIVPIGAHKSFAQSQFVVRDELSKVVKCFLHSAHELTFQHDPGLLKLSLYDWKFSEINTESQSCCLKFI